MDNITVITACYNETSERICYTLDSIVGQDYPSLELVVVDGGSKAEIVTAFEPYRNTIATFISEPDRGLYDAITKEYALPKVIGLSSKTCPPMDR